MNKGNRVFSIVCLGISLWLVLGSFEYNYTVKYTPGPGFLPFWVGIILSLFSIALFIETFIKTRSGKNLNEPPRMPGRKILYRVGGVILLTAGVAVLMTYLGFVLNATLFVSGILFLMERVSVVRSVIIGLAMSVSLYLIFEYWMEIGLPAGFLGF
ncbi:MAG: tripartite tricarboxylate transporter TctB family protein [Desulfobacterales bacterium]|nr:tripartite tricarboxylate transporter TctB family protein [Desulfobacterales bacterium]